jgi:hypothetical protein
MMNMPPPPALSVESSCLDLDTGRYARPPRDLARTSHNKPTPELIKWAEHEGVDVIGGVYRPPDGGAAYGVLYPLGLRLQELKNQTREAILDDLRAGRAPAVRQSESEAIPLLPQPTTTYAFITREGACGFLKLNPSADKPLKRGTPVMGEPAFAFEFVVKKD